AFEIKVGDSTIKVPQGNIVIDHEIVGTATPDAPALTFDNLGVEDKKAVLEQIATAVNDLNAGVGAFINKEKTEISFVADGTSTEPAIDIGGLTAPTWTASAVTIQDLDISTTKGSQEAVLAIDQAIQKIDAQRADLGAV